MSSAMLLRRQFSSTSKVSKRALSAIASAVLNHPISSISPVLTPPKFVNLPASRNDSLSTTRSYARLDFRATFASHAAGFAVADYSDEEKGKGGGGGGGGNEGLEISKLNIHQQVVNCLSNKGITKLFPIQRAVLEPAMQGRDMIGRAKTGTGKTLAFGIPILDKITRYNEKHGLGRDPLALVLAPTRELAKQVEKEFSESSKLETLCVYGGTPISRQMSILNQGVDVVVGTPGRVIDLLKRGALVLSQVQFMVLDEADQMLNVGFAEDVEVILEKLPPKRQTMMFSATMPSWILKLTRQHLKDPVTIDLVGDSDQKLAEGISLHTVVADHHSKAGVIGPLVTEYANGGKCIVFTQTKRDADILAHAVGSKNYRCEALHGDIAQGQRERTLKAFRDGNINVLVATDVAARGLDIPNVDLVIHYELPTTSEIFVHRSGRTGRAGKKGTAILIHTIDQSRAVRVIERDVGGRFKELPPVAPDGAEMYMSRGFSSGGRFGAGGRSGNSSFSRGAGYGNSGFGRFGGGDDFGRSAGYGASSGRSSGYGESGSRYGSPRSGGGGYSNSSQGSSGFGRSGFGKPNNGFGDFGSGRQSGFGDFGFGQKGSGSARSSRFGSFGDDRS